jgi:hypothetical protein
MNNPLLKHFRQPALYVKLPSEGKFWPEGSLELPLTGEIPVYPMTTREEIILRTPDALLNGEGVIQVIQNCCPNIKDAWAMPSIDVDNLLIAVRIASYGANMDIDSECPSCKHENTYEIDLLNLLGQIRAPNYAAGIEIDGLTFHLQPQKYSDTNNRSRILFEEQRILDTITASDMEETAKVTQFNTYLQNLVNINMDMLTASTASITADEVEVSDAAQIKEYYDNAPGTVIRTLQTRIEEYTKEVALKPHAVACEECNHQHEIAVEFDYANFFAVGS